MQTLRHWLDEYWERGHEEVALAQWAVTAQYAPDKADRYLADLNTVLAEADPARLAELVAGHGIDLAETGDQSYEGWLRRVIGQFTEVLAERRP